MLSALDCILIDATVFAEEAHVSLSWRGVLPSSCIATNVCILEAPVLENVSDSNWGAARISQHHAGRV